VLLDDRSSPEGAVRAFEELLGRGCDIVLGPYGSDCVRAVARARGGALVWNHGGASDDVQRLPGVVSVCSPASRYLVALARAVAQLQRGATVAALAARGRFAAFAKAGLEGEAGQLGLTLVAKPADADAVLLCGPLEWELERIRAFDRSKLIGGVSPGLASFARIAGSDAEAEGLLAPVQWHPDLGGPPELEEYVAAQAYAAALIAEDCPDLETARSLRAQTFFGAFELAPDGLQIGHRLSVIRWRGGRRELLLSDAA
jgi:ABC-type branched-subunit amino acid transport system substrate-binding protein